MANDRAGVFDIFALCLGDQCLRDRVLGDNAAPLGGAIPGPSRGPDAAPRVAPPPCGTP
jgi:hypothetical protein